GTRAGRQLGRLQVSVVGVAKHHLRRLLAVEVIERRRRRDLDGEPGGDGIIGPDLEAEIACQLNRTKECSESAAFGNLTLMRDGRSIIDAIDDKRLVGNDAGECSPNLEGF